MTEPAFEHTPRGDPDERTRRDRSADRWWEGRR